MLPAVDNRYRLSYTSCTTTNRSMRLPPVPAVSATGIARRANCACIMTGKTVRRRCRVAAAAAATFLALIGELVLALKSRANSASKKSGATFVKSRGIWDDLVDGHEPLLSLSLAGGRAAALVPAMYFVSNRVRTKEPFRV